MLRRPWYDPDGRLHEYAISSGMPNGSVLGLLLWNIIYKDDPNLLVPEEAPVANYAYDIAGGNTAASIRFLWEAISDVKAWTESYEGKNRSGLVCITKDHKQNCG